MGHECSACKCTLAADAADDNQSVDQIACLPNGWFTRCIDETDYVLCDVCGDQRHFCGGISPYLMDRLDLTDGARCDLTAEALALGVKRRRFRKNAQSA